MKTAINRPRETKKTDSNCQGSSRKCKESGIDNIQTKKAAFLKNHSKFSSITRIARNAFPDYFLSIFVSFAVSR
jgi:hypothetical protein